MPSVDAIELGRPVVFYDGDCGLCHRFVKRAVAADTEGRLRFAPLGGATWQARYGRLAPPPGTMVLALPDGSRLLRSDAVIETLRLIGGPEAARARWIALIPRPIRDFGYALVASVRRHVFKRPDGPCPLMPPGLRPRFLP